MSSLDTENSPPPPPPPPNSPASSSPSQSPFASENTGEQDSSDMSSLPSSHSSDTPQFCDPNTGTCIPTSPFIHSHGEDDKVSTIKSDTMHSLAVTANEAENKEPVSTSLFKNLFSSHISKKQTQEEHDFTLFIPPLMNASIDNPEITYKDIEAAIGKSYIDLSHNHFESNALDVLALYIKGQKLLYTEAKTYCEQQLNFLMLPAIFISCVGSIFSFLSKNYTSGALIIASLNGFNAFLLALISYLKLDAKAQAHKTSAYKFDKLESMCEFNSGRFMFFNTKVEDIEAVVDKIESDVREIKETNQFILPESIRYEFAFTYSTNVFMLVKKTQSIESSEIRNLKNCVNYIATLREQLTKTKSEPNVDKPILKRLAETIQTEEIRKAQIVNKIVHCRKKYFDLDERFNKEIHHHMKRANQWFITRVFCCDWLKS